jgi:aryl-alcohol dehydrogenase-like predicted oxidoreductase
MSLIKLSLISELLYARLVIQRALHVLSMRCARAAREEKTFKGICSASQNKMEYRQLGKTDLKVSPIGIGTEHLKKLPAEEIKQIIDLAISAGVNYFDLVWYFPNIMEGFKQSLQGQSKKPILAFHLGSCIRNGKYERSRDPAHCEKQLINFLSQLGFDFAPILNIHYVATLRVWKQINRKGILALAERLRDEGLARIISVSTHDPEVIKLAASTGAIDSIMHQVNLANHMYEARNEALRRCSELGVGVVAMKPFAGGLLLKAGKKVKIPAYKSGWKRMVFKVPECATPTKLLSYTLSQRGVCTAVTGVSSLKELTSNLAYLSASAVDRDYAALLAE